MSRSIAENLKSVTQSIADACKKANRPVEGVRLVCVTKSASIEDIGKAIGLGIKLVGENRVQDALRKYAVIGDRVEWHLVGHLQTNKAKDAVRIFSMIHSVDSARLAKEIDKEAGKIGKAQDILVQVNTSGEQTKFGVTPAAAEELIKEIVLYHNINIKGLMTIAPDLDDPEKVRPYFRALRELRDKINTLTLLSMGMTNDFEIAIEEGSNMVRIGRAIFEREI